MKNPLIPLFLLSLISWSVSAYLTIFLSPESSQIIIIFLLILFLALSSSLTVIINFVASFFAGHFANKQIIFHESLRRGILIGLAIVGRGILNVVWAYNLLNYLLFISILVLIEIYSSRYTKF